MPLGPARPIIITNCTQRKRRGAVPGIRLSDCAVVGHNQINGWLKALSNQVLRIPARELYCGRSFQDAAATAEALGGELWVASAGLGLVPAETPIPVYEATATENKPDSIPADGPAWFSGLMARSPFATAPDIDGAPLVLAALSSPYLRMMADWLVGAVERRPGRLRLFSRIDPSELPTHLRDSLMPYDARLDDVALGRPGTVSDFAQRALRDFVENVLAEQPEGSLADHWAAVEARLAPAAAPIRPKNRRMSDAEICDLIRAHWQSAAGQSGRMKTLLRGTLGVACEQTRFAGLFRAVAAEIRGTRT